MTQLDRCTTKRRDLRIVLKENGISATFVNGLKTEFRIVRYDGCVIKNELAVDWIVRSDPGDLLLELKGRDIDHAIHQVLVSIKRWRATPGSSANLSAMIVARRYPRNDTKIQRAKDNFVKRKSMRLFVISRNQEFIFERLF